MMLPIVWVDKYNRVQCCLNGSDRGKPQHLGDKCVTVTLCPPKTPQEQAEFTLNQISLFYLKNIDFLKHFTNSGT